MEDILKVFKLIEHKRAQTIGVMVLGILISLFGLVTPWLMKVIIDVLIAISSQEISLEAATSDMTRSIIFLFVVFSINSYLQLVDGYFGAAWYVGTAIDVRKRAFIHLHNLSLNYFETQSSGKIKERIDRGIWDMQEVIDGLITSIIPHIFLIVIAIIVLFRVNPLLTIIAFIGMPIFVFVSIKRTRVLNEKMDKVRTMHEEASGMAMQSILGIKTVKSYNKEFFENKNFAKILDSSFDVDKERFALKSRLNFLRFSIVDITQILVIAYAGFLALHKQITPGDIFLFFAYVNRVYNPLWQLTRLYDKIQERMVSVKRVLELFQTETEVFDLPNAKNIKNVKGEIEFNDVSFSYHNKKVIKGISFRADAGKVVAFVGPSGVGKSTIAKLFMRFYDIDKGNIRIDGKDISTITQKSLREYIGIVLQDTVLFDISIKDNIQYGDLKASIKEIIKAAKVANAHEFIMKLPNGYDTIVGERGVKLSGGEQQRINIARAVLKNAPILILDEATSHLDSESERLVQEALWKLIEGKTTIIIAHRLATVMRADKIIVLDKGKIVEEGIHQELIKKDGLYAKLFKIQSGAMLLTDKEVKV